MRFRFPSRSNGKSDSHGCLPPDPNDAALVAAARVDSRAFTALYERYLGPIYRYCFARLGNQEAAEDATSEIFLKALAALPDYRDGVFAAWLFQIAHNVVVDYFRRQRPTAPLEFASEPCDPDPPPEELAIAMTDAATLRAALGRLSGEQRTVIDLQLAGWSPQEIATAIGKSAAAVKMLRFRALGRLRPPEPNGTFATRLRDRLEAQATAMPPHGDVADPGRRWPRLRFPTLATRLPLVGLAAAAVFVFALLGAMLWMMQPQTVNAQEIIRKAQATLTAPEASQIRSFVLTEVTRSRPTARAKAEASYNGAGYTDGEQLRTETTQWYEAPNRWRIEMTGTVIRPDGKEIPNRTWRQLNVSDGIDHWSFDPLHQSGQVQRFDLGLDGTGGVARFGLDASDLDTVLARASTCGTPMLKGTETVAGRSAYVIDLGPPKCWASDPEGNGPSTIWVDKETFFVLKAVHYSGTDGQLLSTTEVTRIQYNVPIDPARFCFTPPPGAKIEDDRPKPTPSADQYRQELAQLARQVDFPLFVPHAAPSGLVPLQPRLDDVEGLQVQLSYVPSDEAGKAAIAGSTGVQITEQKASDELIDRWTQQAQPASIAGGQGWLWGGRAIKGGSTNSAAIVLRDGTLISVTSIAVPANELVKIAGSLEPVPESHPPLPDPTPQTLAELRRHAAISVFVPTWLPAGLTPEPPVGGEQPTQNVEIRYYSGDGAVGLTVGNGSLDCCPGYALLPSEPVALPNGLEGHLIRTPTTTYGGLTLWWQQDGTTVTLTGPAVSEGDMKKIATSMSKTAGLRPTEASPAQLTPTPILPVSENPVN